MCRTASAKARERTDVGLHRHRATAQGKGRVCAASLFLLLMTAIGEGRQVSEGKSENDVPRKRYLLVEMCDFTGLGVGTLHGVRFEVTRIYRAPASMLSG